jgi:hypothetical protein
MYSSQVLQTALLAKHPEIRIRGFSEALRKYVAERRPDADEEDLDNFREGLGLVPDGYVLCDDEDAVIIFEIEVLHPVYKKAARVYDLFWGLDAVGIGLSIITVDAYGRLAPLSPLQLVQYIADKADNESAADA